MSKPGYFVYFSQKIDPTEQAVHIHVVLALSKSTRLLPSKAKVQLPQIANISTRMLTIAHPHYQCPGELQSQWGASVQTRGVWEH